MTLFRTLSKFLRKYNKQIRRVIYLVLFMSGALHAHDYRARVDVADWHLQLSPMECRMWQVVPNYGEAVFSYKAGDQQRFYLHTEKSLTTVGNVDISSIPPGWRYNQPARFIASSKSSLGTMPVRLSEQLANRLLAELEEGMFPSFTHKAWHSGHELMIYVSAVNFSAAYRDYLKCVADLSPTSYDNISGSMSYDEVTRSIPMSNSPDDAGRGDGKINTDMESAENTSSTALGEGMNDQVRSIFLFATDHWQMTPAMLQHVARIAASVRDNESVRRVHVDGHTDDVASRAYNWELSRKRGESIKQGLIKAGVDPAMIIMKYHGEDSPRVPNSSAKNRSKNRRVVVVLDKN